MRTQGTANQSISAGDQPIRHGGQTFNGPQQVHYDFTFRSYELVGRGRYLFGGGSGFRGRTGRYGIEALLGVSAPRLEFGASSPSQQGSETIGTVNVVAGVGGLLNLTASTSV
jgi:hypothetical protein